MIDLLLVPLSHLPRIGSNTYRHPRLVAGGPSPATFEGPSLSRMISGVIVNVQKPAAGLGLQPGFEARKARELALCASSQVLVTDQRGT